MLSIIRNVSFQKKIFAPLVYKLNHNRNVPMFYQHLRLIKFSIQPLRSCTTVSPSSPSETKYYNSRIIIRENFLDSLHYTLNENFTLEALEKPDLALIYKRFNLKGLSIQCMQKYNLRVSPDFTTIFFPFDSMDKKVSAIQTMKYNEKIYPQDFSAGTEDLFLFGWSLVDSQDKTIVITSHPLDAIAVNQVLDVAAVCAPYCYFPSSPELLSVLNEFPKVIFWLSLPLYYAHLPKSLHSVLKDKVYFIRCNYENSPLCCLQNDLKQFLKEAQPLYDRRLETFDTYKDLMYEAIRYR